MRCEKENPIFGAELTCTNTIDDPVVFSAHFDSVLMAPGATDDGIRVIVLVKTLEFLSKNRPRRMAVFNFDNGEHQLHGAQAYALSYFVSPSFLFTSFDRFLRYP
jgi:Zn-dependent M28 family amino/carboxypeptidase